MQTNEYTVYEKAHMSPKGNLNDLAELFLEDNPLKELPCELERLTSLSILYSFGNELGQSDFDLSCLANLTYVIIETPG